MPLRIKKANTSTLNQILPEGKAKENFKRKLFYVGCICANLDQSIGKFHLPFVGNFSFLSSLFICKQPCSVCLSSPSSFSFGFRPAFSKFSKIKNNVQNFFNDKT